MKYLKLFENFANELDSLEINEILKGYIDAALWTEEERLKDDIESENDFDNNEDDEDNDELEKLMKLNSNFKSKSIINFTQEDIEPNSLIKAYSDIKQFIKSAGVAIQYAIEQNMRGYKTKSGYIEALSQIGHDIWLTKNHHGAGFFDHSYDDDMEKLLMDAAHNLKETNLFINDDGKLSFDNENE